MKNDTEKRIQIRVNGFLNRNTNKEFDKVMSGLSVRRNEQLVLVLNNTKMDDLKAVQTLIRLNDNVRRNGGELILKNISASVKTILKITRTLNYFTIENQDSVYAQQIA